eukprot:539279-Pelagomonas_calceolata.AAC.1
MACLNEECLAANQACGRRRRGPSSSTSGAMCLQAGMKCVIWCAKLVKGEMWAVRQNLLVHITIQGMEQQCVCPCA